MTVKVRIAPSPTGALHIGTARTALLNWLFARHHGGEFILRIEDTDLERSKPEYEEDILEGLRWLGLEWDNTSILRQSERLDVYRAYLKQLVDAGVAVERIFSEEEKEEMRKEGREPRDSIIILAPPDDPEREIAFDDAVRGRIAIQAKHVGQISLAKDMDTPLYNFAVVVDDIDMDITHVIRGEDHISNTPKQLLIYEALGKQPPQFAHAPLLLGPDRSKLSKRHGATSVNAYRDDYLPGALVNFMGLLGYTYDKEILSREEMIEQFELTRIHKAGAIFDVTKLDWMNGQYLRALPPAEIKKLIGQPDITDAAIPIITERLERISDSKEFEYLWEDPDVDPALLPWKEDGIESALRALTICALLADNEALTQANLDQAAVDHFEGQKGSVYWPLRVALSGRRASAGPLDIISVIGYERTRKRIEKAIRLLQS